MSKAAHKKVFLRHDKSPQLKQNKKWLSQASGLDVMIRGIVFLYWKKE
ncbi:hypothetical protein AB434_0417 [Heyndrickxia coagulans]|uniref:Uncharacterized protein n=1 Tax=Heyndrickxia coagulans TaxID=1398 RepID=A0AAN0T4A8_HEYCO|nr:hypothetical protein SB48_HM08orf01178 [Heyndrickxia coagulans]AKN52822.1 hypothetical protein AB434_0417 [Heyndrickxia coagulans]